MQPPVFSALGLCATTVDSHVDERSVEGAWTGPWSPSMYRCDADMREWHSCVLPWSWSPASPKVLRLHKPSPFPILLVLLATVQTWNGCTLLPHCYSFIAGTYEWEKRLVLVCAVTIVILTVMLKCLEQAVHFDYQCCWYYFTSVPFQECMGGGGGGARRWFFFT